MTWGNITEAVFIGVALAMDAMAASVALGAAGKKDFCWKKIALTAGFFGFFQFFMPLAGFYGSCFAEKLAQSWGHWIGGGLLILLGGKMFFEKEEEKNEVFSLKKLFILAFATSIDALLVGVSYRCIHRVCILPDTVIIGVVTFFIATAGCIAGRLSGRLLGAHCNYLGAVVLIMLGLKIIIFS